GRFLVVLLLTLTVVAVGTWLLHKSQVRRNAVVLYNLATEAYDLATEAEEVVRAVEYDKRYFALIPTDLDALDKRAAKAKATAARQFVRAAEHYKRYLALIPADLDALEKYGLVLDRVAVFPDPRGRRRAFLILERVVRDSPERADLRRQLIRIAMSPDLQRYSDALDHIKILRKNPPDDADLEVFYARCLERSDATKAVAAYREAIKLAP